MFIYRRALDQVAMSVAYPNVPVRMFGFLPGILTPGGATHQAIEDIAVMRALPNMTILECGDATEVESVLDVAQAVQGSVYVRMLRGEIPRLFPQSEPMQLGVARHLSYGTDLTLISSGICTEEAMRATKVVRGASHGVITMENHTIMGGLGTAVAEVMAENGIGRPLVRIGLQDRFAHGEPVPERLVWEYQHQARYPRRQLGPSGFVAGRVYWAAIWSRGVAQFTRGPESAVALHGTQTDGTVRWGTGRFGVRVCVGGHRSHQGRSRPGRPVLRTMEERVAHCSEAVARANQVTGRHSLYLRNITGPTVCYVPMKRRNSVRADF